MSTVDTEAPTEPLTLMLAAIKATQSKAQYTCKRYVGEEGEGKRESEEKRRERVRERRESKRKGRTRERTRARTCSIWFPRMVCVLDYLIPADFASSSFFLTPIFSPPSFLATKQMKSYSHSLQGLFKLDIPPPRAH